MYPSAESDTRGLAADLMRERDSLATDLATLRSTLAEVTGERDEARRTVEKQALSLLDFADARTDRDSWKAKAEASAANEAVALRRVVTQREAMAEINLFQQRQAYQNGNHQAAAAERARIAEWLENWEPDYYADAADNRAMSVDAVLILAAQRIRANPPSTESEEGE